ncbi:MAG: YebC/PmpR family DNA-binding transcriptional regulator [Ruminococcaceae bacterium]|nr:YebC/PmpR family DNA-binding transcriptional regulator [Oscillospiraceae bacterium]
MSGHSKWKNIMHKKEKTDLQRAKIFTKIGKEMTIAIREGGPDPASNSKLKDLITKAKSNNVPNDNIERIIKKASGGDDTANYETLNYEGYGPSGVAVIVEATTDNRNRTGADMRHYFDKFGGNLGQTGCVSYLFSDKGLIVIEDDGIDEEKLMDDALSAGAEDILSEEGAFEIYTAPEDFSNVCEYLENAGYKFASAEQTKIPANYVTLTEEDDVTKMNRLLEMLEDNDDVMNVWHNWENEDE